MPAGSLSTSKSGVRAAHQHLISSRASASSGDSREHANPRPAPEAGVAHLPEVSLITDEHGCRQPETKFIRGSGDYAHVMARPVAPLQPNGSLKPIVTDSKPSEIVVSVETTNRPWAMSGVLSDEQDSTNHHDQVAYNALEA